MIELVALRLGTDAAKISVQEGITQDRLITNERFHINLHQTLRLVKPLNNVA